MFLVMRKPVLMEDEGRYETAGQFDTKDDAQTWINEQAGYFHPSDYLIVEA